jgi:alpha-ketoglutarate-dependent 2,4-dichlorophenoxyacetate dioxygenase
MELVPLGPGFGVEVKGVTMLDVATDAQAYKAVRSAFETHSLLVFRDQPIADDIQVSPTAAPSGRSNSPRRPRWAPTASTPA